MLLFQNAAVPGAAVYFCNMKLHLNSTRNFCSEPELMNKTTFFSVTGQEWQEQQQEKELWKPYALQSLLEQFTN